MIANAMASLCYLFRARCSRSIKCNWICNKLDSDRALSRVVWEVKRSRSTINAKWQMGQSKQGYQIVCSPRQLSTTACSRGADYEEVRRGGCASDIRGHGCELSGALRCSVSQDRLCERG